MKPIKAVNGHYFLSAMSVRTARPKNPRRRVISARAFTSQCSPLSLTSKIRNDARSRLLAFEADAEAITGCKVLDDHFVVAMNMTVQYEFGAVLTYHAIECLCIRQGFALRNLADERRVMNADAANVPLVSFKMWSSLDNCS